MQSAAGLKKSTHKAPAAPPPPKHTIICLAFTLHPLSPWLIRHRLPNNTTELQEPPVATGERNSYLRMRVMVSLRSLPWKGSAPVSISNWEGNRRGVMCEQGSGFTAPFLPVRVPSLAVTGSVCSQQQPGSQGLQGSAGSCQSPGTSGCQTGAPDLHRQRWPGVGTGTGHPKETPHTPERPQRPHTPERPQRDPHPPQRDSTATPQAPQPLTAQHPLAQQPGGSSAPAGGLNSPLGSAPGLWGAFFPQVRCGGHTATQSHVCCCRAAIPALEGHPP